MDAWYNLVFRSISNANTRQRRGSLSAIVDRCEGSSCPCGSYSAPGVRAAGLCRASLPYCVSGMNQRAAWSSAAHGHEDRLEDEFVVNWSWRPIQQVCEKNP
jgi:hypothetical protein